MKRKMEFIITTIIFTIVQLMGQHHPVSHSHAELQILCGG